MSVAVTTLCTALHARYTEIIGQLAGLPAGGSVSEKGRSLSVSASELTAQLKVVTDQASMLGCPVGTIGDPAAVITRARA